MKNYNPIPLQSLRSLSVKHAVITDLPPIDLSIGEPKHTTPELILNELQKQLPKAASYPTTRGIDELRQTIAE